MMKGETLYVYSKILELAASDDLSGFVHEVEDQGRDVDEASFWYGRKLGLKKMALEERTPIMIAALFGSTEILRYIIRTGKVDVNRASGSDRATALHCAAAGGAESAFEAVNILLDASADPMAMDYNGNKPADLVSRSKWRLEMLLKGKGDESLDDPWEQEGRFYRREKEILGEKKEYRSEVQLPDINNGVYVTDEFRMYTFKVKPCSRAYSHDWTECPFVHPGENARRRDPRKYPYSCVPCPEFRKGSCRQGDGCEYAHGVFECWLHPAQYRTRLCKDEDSCTRKVCFFAHKPEELRPLYASTGSAIPSPKSIAMDSMLFLSTPPSSPSAAAVAWNKLNFVPPSLQLPGSRLKTSSADNAVSALETILARRSMIDELPNLSSPILSGYPASSSPMSSFRLESVGTPSPVNARSTAFSRRSQSFAVNRASLSGWSSPDGKLDWTARGDELNRYRKSLSFAPAAGKNAATLNQPFAAASTMYYSSPVAEEPDVSWVHSLVKDVSSDLPSYHDVSPWCEQLYSEQEQVVA